MRTLVISFLVAVLLGLAGRVARADVVILRDGGRIDGEILRETATELEVKLPYGRITVPLTEVVRIERAASPEKEFARRRAALRPGDADERVALGRLALERLYASPLAGELALEAWSADPGHPGALALLRELDYRYDESGTFAPATRWYEAHAFVRREKKWVTREEAAWLDARARTAAARTDLARAERAVSDADRAVEGGAEAESAGRARIAWLRAESAAIDGRRAAAQAELDAREADLDRAAYDLAEARRLLEVLTLQHAGCDEEGRRRLAPALAAADRAYAYARNREQQARRARDAALAEVKGLAQEVARLSAAILAELGAIDEALARARAAVAARPRLAHEAGEAAAALRGAEGAETRAKATADARRASEERAERAREAALARAIAGRRGEKR